MLIYLVTFSQYLVDCFIPSCPLHFQRAVDRELSSICTKRYQYHQHPVYSASKMLMTTCIVVWSLPLTTLAFARQPAMVARAPQADSTSVVLGTASGGALDLSATQVPHVRPKAALAGGSDLTIQVVNSYGVPLSIFYGSNAGAPTPVGNPGSGVLTSSTKVLFPSAWAGRITIGRTYDPLGSKIEASFSPPNYVPDVDISYVDGFSVPISCSCSGVAVTGCNIRRYSLPQFVFSSHVCALKSAASALQ